MSFAINAINNHASDIEVRIKVLKSHYRCGNGGRNGFTVHQ
ncbi:Uncharacterised protein [Citrobacter koseri]|uniref:Uncharacterized protein n=1 Tax=Citrobacter koseri TaxID=545 RepID=A0A2X2VVG5_CITKO|nr:Uncharacterised protein [Citrobacter koseri]